MSLTDDDKKWIQDQLAGVATKVDFERVETNLLTAFHQWASPAEACARSHTAVARALDLEMEALAVRVEKLEKPEDRASW